MNKDVIYIEPEDDITDIILKIENSKEKIVALVPPKKAGVFRSVVNIKLIAKAGASSDKKIVLVTVDPSIVKLAASAKLPVTKNLQTPPTIPVVEADAKETSKEELIEESDGTVEAKEDVDDLSEDEDGKKKTNGKKAKKQPEDEEEEDDDDEDEEGDNDDSDDDDEDDTPLAKKDKKTKKGSTGKAAKAAVSTAGKGIIGWIKVHKKLSIGAGIGSVVLILVLIWALAIAPAVTVTINIRATSNPFSETVKFVTNQSDEDAEEGKFYLAEKKIEKVQEVVMTATGEKNIGEKAKGEVVVYTYFKKDGTVQVSAGSSFTFNGLSFVSDKVITLSWDGKDAKSCENNGEASAITSGCLIHGRVSVTAAAPGAAYNVAASNTGWNTTAPVAVYSDKAMSGGTDNMIKVVQQSDVEKAKAELASSDENATKEALLEKIGEDDMAIESSFKQTTSSAEPTPAVDEEVKEGVTPKLKATTTATMYYIDKTKVEEFIRYKAKLSESQEIYEIKNPFIENFSQTDSGYTSKLKTTYFTGPKLSESDIVEKIRGKGLGDAQHVLKDIDGISQVTIDKSFPWVMNVPNDTNKVTIYFDVKDQDGADINIKAEDDKQDSSEKKDSKDNKDSKDDKDDSQKGDEE